MVAKERLFQILSDNRREVGEYRIVHRSIDTGGVGCCVFVGVRRAGKSFVLFEKMQKMLRDGRTWNEMLYLNFEDERLVGFDCDDFNKILECHIEMGGNEKPMMFLDEIQNISGWEKFARRLADRKFAVWITGSNANMLSKDIMTTLGGRYLPIEVYPFGFEEYLRARDIPYDSRTIAGTMGRATVMREYAEYMKWGGLPESIGLPVKRNYISSVYQKIYLGDICSRNKISNQNLLRLMVKKMAESVMQPQSYSRIAKVLSSVGGKITVPTTSSYIGYCQDAWLLLRVRNISAAFAEKESNCKYYFIDNGLLNIQTTEATAALLENIVAISLFRKYGCDTDNDRIYYYHSNIDVDFYIPDWETAIQVSYSIADETTCKREVEALRKLSKFKPCTRRIIITYDEERTISDERGTIEVIPCWRWLLEQ